MEKKSDNLNDYILENIRFSFSSASTFETCKHSWFLTYIEGNEREGNFFAEYGSFIHKIMEMFWREELEQFELADYYRENYQSNVVCLPPPYPVGMGDRYYEDGLTFFSNLKFKRENFDVIFLEDKIDSVLGEYNLVVKPDLVLRNKKTGKTILLDYKSSKPMKNGKWDDTKLAGYEKQLILYAHFIEKEMGIKIDEIALLFTRIPENPLYAIQMTPEKVQNVLSWFSETIEQIWEEDTFEASPSKYFCQNLCSVRKFCKYAKF